MKKILVILFIFFSSINIYADCLACWTLVPVKISLTNYKVIDGYVLWNNAWLETSSGQFNSDFIAFHKKQNDHVLIYKKIVFIDSIFKNTPVALDTQIDTISVGEIKSIDIRQVSIKNYTGAGPMIVISKKMQQLFKTRPVARYNLEDEVSGASRLIIISYNKTIRLENLIEISKNSTLLDKDKLEKKNVFVFLEAWD
jgi:hypothetical protein